MAGSQTIILGNLGLNDVSTQLANLLISLTTSLDNSVSSVGNNGTVPKSTPQQLGNLSLLGFGAAEVGTTFGKVCGALRGIITGKNIFQEITNGGTGGYLDGAYGRANFLQICFNALNGGYDNIGSTSGAFQFVFGTLLSTLNNLFGVLITVLLAIGTGTISLNTLFSRSFIASGTAFQANANITKNISNYTNPTG